MNAESSIAKNLPRMPAEDYKVIVRPKGGLDLAGATLNKLQSAVKAAAGIDEGKSTDMMMVNAKQNIIIYSTPDEGRMTKLDHITPLKIGGKSYEVRAYAAPDDKCGR
ncbi:hypothetical protein HPB49_018401 [Dermacentor silvarum]|uniref:Uncharacterized protein n=1 Tax=Dermacentor silvarum TaxID=543639 RepID=A0ACB8CMA2_DERSI|nr:hypothetical protein HPB49_018401 [Dermacentor silvarum]